MTLWQQREGQTVDGILPLLRHLGGGAGSAVFLTEYDETNPRRAAIKLIPVSEAETGQLAAWETASTLSHPHLIQILAGGECQFEDESYVYVVTEYADEDLAQVLSDRVLTPAEAREMAGSVVDALGYLHKNGFVHGHLTPSNIMAVGEQVKISSDTVHQGGSPAEDARSLGVVLRQALGSPAQLPQPFADIVRECAKPDPSMAEIEARLGATESQAAAAPPTVAKKPSRWPIAAVAAGALIVALGAWLMRAPRTGTAVVTPAPAAEAPKAINPTPNAPSRGEVVTQVLPEIPSKARNTINGKVLVNVKVRVDQSGNVQAATIEPPRTSRYLSDLTAAAARRWKFEPGNAPEEWLLRFQLFRDHSTVSATRVGSK